MQTTEIFTKRGIKKKKYLPRLRENIVNLWQLYLFVLPAILIVLIFNYWPMYGLQIAFKDYRPALGIAGSPWVGLKHFGRFLNGVLFFRLLKNTLSLSIYGLIVGFPIPIVLALTLNQLEQERFKKLLQTVTYLPHFISTVVICGMILVFLSPRAGFFASISRVLGNDDPRNIMGEPGLFSSIYVLSGIWQHTGWNSIIFLAALSGVNPNLYDAADIDGASKFQKTIHIDFPSIVPTVIMLLILTFGRLMSVEFEKVYLLQNSLNTKVSEVIATYVFKQGIQGGQYSFASAVGLFNNVVNCLLLVTVNTIVRKKSEHSLW